MKKIYKATAVILSMLILITGSSLVYAMEEYNAPGEESVLPEMTEFSLESTMQQEQAEAEAQPEQYYQPDQYYQQEQAEAEAQPEHYYQPEQYYQQEQAEAEAQPEQYYQQEQPETEPQPEQYYQQEQPAIEVQDMESQMQEQPAPEPIGMEVQYQKQPTSEPIGMEMLSQEQPALAEQGVVNQMPEQLTPEPTGIENQSQEQPVPEMQETETQPQEQPAPESQGSEIQPRIQPSEPGENTDPIVYQLNVVPVKTGIIFKEQELFANTAYSEVLEIKNISNHTMTDIELTVWSEDDLFIITSFLNMEQLQTALNNADVNCGTEESAADYKQRTLRIKELAPQASIKTEIILWAQENMIPDSPGTEAQILCEFSANGGRFACRGSWKIVKEEPASEPESAEQEQLDTTEPGQPGTTEPEQAESAEQEQPDTTEPEQAESAEPGQPGTTEPEQAESAEQEQTDTTELKQAESTESEQAESVETDQTEIEEPIPTEADQPEQAEPAETEQTETKEPIPEEENRAEQAEDAVSEQAEQKEEPMEDEIISFTIIDEETDGDEETQEIDEFYEDYYYDDGSYYYDDWVVYDGVSGVDQINTAVPYLLVKSYSHKRVINTGDEFGLEVTLLNTSQKLNIENVMIKIETSDSLSLSNGTNTLFVNAVEAGGTTTQSMNLLAASECKDASQKITLNITYDYVENKERKQGTATECITIPVSQQDRLELRDPVIDYMEAGQEGVISVSYVNKGFSSLYNMEASITLENAEAVQNVVYAGNVESGKSGTLDFLITPLEEGDYFGEITLRYENASQKEVAVAIPLQFTSTMAYVADEYLYDEEDYMMEEYTETSSFPWVWVAAGGAALILAIVITVILVRRKKKAKAGQDDINDWFEILNTGNTGTDTQ